MPDPIDGGNGAPAPDTTSGTDVIPVDGGPARDFDPSENDFAASGAPEGGAAGGSGGAAPAPVPADPNQRAGNVPAAAQGQAPAGGDWQSIREAATGYGYNFGAGITDDRAALVHLIQAAQQNRQADYYAQLGRQLAPQAQQIQQYLASQSQAQTPAGRDPWEAPEFDERWASLVDRDERTGLFVSKPGVPHEIATKVNAYAEWKSNYDKNPASVINGMVEARAKAIAEQTFREQFAGQQRSATVQGIVGENAAWLYAVDASGNRVVNPVNGQYTPTPVGARYIHHLAAVQQMGVTDPRAQDRLAKELVRGEYARNAQNQAVAAATAAASPQTQQQAARPNINALQALPPNQRAQAAGATEPSEVGLSLQEMLRRGMDAEGVTDADFANISG